MYAELHCTAHQSRDTIMSIQHTRAPKGACGASLFSLEIQKQNENVLFNPYLGLNFNAYLIHILHSAFPKFVLLFCMLGRTGGRKGYCRVLPFDDLT